MRQEHWQARHHPPCWGGWRIYRHAACLQEQGSQCHFSVYISRTAPDAEWQYLRNPDRMPIMCPACRCGIPERVPIDKFVQFIPVGVESTSFIGGIPYGYTPIPKHIKLGGVINMVIAKRAWIQGISLPEVRNVE